MKFYYVYILQSEENSNHFYTGFTENLESRLKSNNSGKCLHTSKYKSWKIKTAISLSDNEKALDFERCLKKPRVEHFQKNAFEMKLPAISGWGILNLNQI